MRRVRRRWSWLLRSRQFCSRLRRGRLRLRNSAACFEQRCQMRQSLRWSLLVLMGDRLEDASLCLSPLSSALASLAFLICSRPLGAPFSRRAAYPRRSPTTKATPNQIARIVTASPFTRNASLPILLAKYTSRSSGRQTTQERRQPRPHRTGRLLLFGGAADKLRFVTTLPGLALPLCTQRVLCRRAESRTGHLRSAGLLYVT